MTSSAPESTSASRPTSSATVIGPILNWLERVLPHVTPSLQPSSRRPGLRRQQIRHTRIRAGRLILLGNTGCSELLSDLGREDGIVQDAHHDVLGNLVHVHLAHRFEARFLCNPEIDSRGIYALSVVAVGGEDVVEDEPGPWRRTPRAGTGRRAGSASRTRRIDAVDVVRSRRPCGASRGRACRGGARGAAWRCAFTTFALVVGEHRLGLGEQVEDRQLLLGEALDGRPAAPPR